MTLQEAGSAVALRDFLQANRNVIATFSAHWCGPCRASRPQLESLAQSHNNNGNVKFVIVYEENLRNDDVLHSVYNIRAFPTYVRFLSGREQERVEGVNFVGIENMIKNCKVDLTGGNKLAGNAVTLDPQQARLARLAKLGGGNNNESSTTPSKANDSINDKEDSEKNADKEIDADVVMNEVTNEDDKMPATTEDGSDDATPTPTDTNATTQQNPLDSLDKKAIDTLTDGMGFTLLRVQKGLLNGNNTVEGAIEWLTQHQDDDDIDDPIDVDKLSAAAGAVAQSYKCNECGRILSNMANLELHANKTGHSDFEESTQSVKPLTEEEKQAKITEIKELLKAKRNEREHAEKEDQIQREKQRRTMGQAMTKTREQLEAEQRKREAQQRKREKEDFARERERIRAELAKDRAERQARGGKLQSRLGVEGYQPDGIQYDVDVENSSSTPANDADDAALKAKKLKASAAKIDEYIAKVASYKAGGDGGRCLKILKAYVGNVVDHPDEEKYRSVNTENKTYKLRVKQLIGAKSLLVAVGFQPSEDGSALVLAPDADRQLLADTKVKLDKAIIEYDK